jgi:hypothetical protein
MTKTQPRVGGLGLAAVFVALLAVGVGAAVIAGCGSSSSQAAARDRATTQSCDWYQMCGDIGAGKTFDTLDSCEVQVRAHWDSTWPAASCDGKINEANLEVCLAAIYSTGCTNGLDILDTLAVKCAEAKVCAGAGSTSPDGG